MRAGVPTASQHCRITVVPDGGAMAEMAAERLIARIAQTQGEAAICLTGGSSPQPLYRLLARDGRRWRPIADNGRG